MSKSTLQMLQAVADDQISASDAVQKCVQAYQNAYATHAKTADGRQYAWHCDEKAKQAFKLSMPTLASRAEIHEFVACVAWGALLQVFTAQDTSRLLYAAQVSFSTIEQRPARKVVAA
jgi:hypothetical protein